MKIERTNWVGGDAGRQFGRVLHDQVSPRERPRWASAVLAVAMREVVPIRAVEDLLRIAETPTRWPEAHAQFSRIRELTVAADKAPNSHPMYRALLRLAETVAKITYNASGGSAPFDDHAGWRLAVDARQLAELRRDPRLDARLWEALSGQAATSAI